MAVDACSTLWLWWFGGLRLIGCPCWWRGNEKMKSVTSSSASGVSWISLNRLLTTTLASTVRWWFVCRTSGQQNGCLIVSSLSFALWLKLIPLPVLPTPHPCIRWSLGSYCQSKWCSTSSLILEGLGFLPLGPRKQRSSLSLEEEPGREGNWDCIIWPHKENMACFDAEVLEAEVCYMQKGD